MSLTKAYRFVVQYFKQAFKPPFHFAEVINQCFEIGLRALPLITLTGFIIGIVFTKQILLNFNQSFGFVMIMSMADMPVIRF